MGGDDKDQSPNFKKFEDLCCDLFNSIRACPAPPANGRIRSSLMKHIQSIEAARSPGSER